MITTMMGVIIVLLVILVLKMTKKCTHNMTLMSRYEGLSLVNKCQQYPKEKFFLPEEVFP